MFRGHRSLAPPVPPQGVTGLGARLRQPLRAECPMSEPSRPPAPRRCPPARPSSLTANAITDLTCVLVVPRSEVAKGARKPLLLPLLLLVLTCTRDKFHIMMYGVCAWMSFSMNQACVIAI